jgi:hypothetical protein
MADRWSVAFGSRSQGRWRDCCKEFTWLVSPGGTGLRGLLPVNDQMAGSASEKSHVFFRLLDENK